jgi:dTDP-4-amino-4,6-dideoxygalactose transaminase
VSLAPASTIPFLDLTDVTEAVQDEVMRGWRDVLDARAFVGGAAVPAFEERFAAFCGAEHAVGMANGTDALHLTFRALGIGPGDEVVVPANTFVATVEAVVLAGARPRFADVDPETLLLSPATLAAAVTPRTRAVAVVHLYGQMPDLTALTATAQEHDLVVVEDAAQAHGATWQGRPAGSFGTAGCFSFYPGKNLGAFGDAGAVVTSDADLAARLRSMRDHGRAPSGHHEHGVLGTNSRLDTLQAVVLDAKLRRLEAWNASRRRLAAAYRRLLDPAAVPVVAELPGSQGAYHLLVVRVPERERVRQVLSDAGVATGIHYPTPCHLMAPYAEYADGPLPVVELAGDEVLSLPLYPSLQLVDVERVAAVLTEAVAGSLVA